ncbi:MAG TPA: transcription antitermination factor NusB [Verrucomicrobiales bacterium]|nr:transcription antitermination factor NusB [Verrucomicrobiales bacterium]
MSKRREGRETAVQLLFSREFVPRGGEHDIDAFFELHSAARGVRAHAEELYQGVSGKLKEIDAMIVPVLENFSLQRLSGVDRNILRVAVYEMYYCESVPPVVAISEAIEVAKRFGGLESGRFINGVLDKLKEGVARPLREATRQAKRPKRDREGS